MGVVTGSIRRPKDGLHMVLHMNPGGKRPGEGGGGGGEGASFKDSSCMFSGSAKPLL